MDETADQPAEASLRDIVDAIDRLAVAVYCSSAPALVAASNGEAGASAHNLVRFATQLAYATLVATPAGTSRLASMEAVVEELKHQARLQARAADQALLRKAEAEAKYDNLAEQVRKNGVTELDFSARP